MLKNVRQDAKHRHTKVDLIYEQTTEHCKDAGDLNGNGLIIVLNLSRATDKRVVVL